MGLVDLLTVFDESWYFPFSPAGLVMRGSETFRSYASRNEVKEAAEEKSLLYLVQVLSALGAQLPLIPQAPTPTCPAVAWCVGGSR
jgi:hypothetical protein